MVRSPSIVPTSRAPSVFDLQLRVAVLTGPHKVWILAEIDYDKLIFYTCIIVTSYVLAFMVVIRKLFQEMVLWVR